MIGSRICEWVSSLVVIYVIDHGAGGARVGHCGADS